MTDSQYPGDTATTSFTRSDTADAQTVARFRHELSLWLRTHFALDPARLNDVLLAVNEALTNSAEFAYPQGPGPVTMTANYHVADGTLTVEVSDEGTWRHTDPKTRSNTRGRGIPLMRALADHTTISPLSTGTHVHMQFGRCALITEQSHATSA